MDNTRKHKKIIIILLVIIVAIYIFYSYTITGIYLQLDFLIIPETEQLTFVNFFFLGTAQFFSLLLVPITTLILLNVKELDLGKRYLISRILVAVSLPVILINLVLFYVINWIWGFFLTIDISFWQYSLAFAFMYLVEFALSLAVFLLLRLKSEIK